MIQKKIKTPKPHSQPNPLREPAARITGTTFDYHRVGHDHRLMTFLSGGLIGKGARSGEIFWKLGKRGSQVALEISSESAVTCRLMEGTDKVWRGKWLNFERMPVELVPVANLAPRTARPNPLPESLFVVSLPRSLSTLVYHRVRHAVGLSSPVWTSDGEILNVDRFSLFAGPTHDTNVKFVSRTSNPGIYYGTVDFLDQLVQPFGFVYKDVVQPFITAAWLKRNRILTIRIKRNLADVAYSMIEKEWWYPARMFPDTANQEYALVQGLVRAERALDSISAEHIDFDQLIADEKLLQTALHNLYGDRPITSVKFIDDKFIAMRTQISRRRDTPKHKKLLKYVATARRADIQKCAD